MVNLSRRAPMHQVVMPMGFVPAPAFAAPALGQAASGCPSSVWPFIGGMVTWAFLGKAILGILGVGRTAAERGVEQLRGYVEPPRARLPQPSGSRERRVRRSPKSWTSRYERRPLPERQQQGRALAGAGEGCGCQG